MKGVSQLISDPYTALSAILKTNTTITSLLGTFIDSAIPLIQGGVLAEHEINLPAITFYASNLNALQVATDTLFVVNCYAGTERESFILAQTLIKELNEVDSGIDGYMARTTARIIGSVPNPQEREINTPVEVRIYNF